MAFCCVWNNCSVIISGALLYTVVLGVMKCPMPKYHCLSINYEIFVLIWRFSATSQKISQWFSSMTLYVKWPHKLGDFNNIEPYLPQLYNLEMFDSKLA